MTELEKERYISYMTLKDELTAFSGHGAELYLDGRRSDAGKIAAACVFQEDTDYMRDYVRDEFISEVWYGKEPPWRK